MHQSNELRAFLTSYEEYVKRVIRPTRRELKEILGGWRKPGYWGKYTERSRQPAPSPVQRAFTRIKRPESVVDKISRNPKNYPDGLKRESLLRMHDVLGGRVILYFLSHFPLVDREIRNHDRLEVSEDDPPVAYLREDLAQRLSLVELRQREKDSGYASVHYIVRIRDSDVPPDERPWIELQVRTLAEDVWGEIEHILGYKPNKRTSFAVRKQFKLLSESLVTIDQHFNFLYEELSRFQDEVLVSDDDPLNAENLPVVLSELGIGCAQKEIDGLLKLLNSRGLSTVGGLRSATTIHRLEVIRSTYRNEEGRAPENFEVVANIAALSAADDGAEEIAIIRAQIAYLKAWDELRKGL